jgi:hypothetical protein
MPISHGHKPFVYEDFIPEMEASSLINAAKIKQNLYDEGTAKIQEFYDKLSTLPVYKDEDKQYLNQELNKIRNVLQTNVGSADFSNPQTVRSFMGIAKPLTSDPVLKNAIESTEELNTRIKTIEEIKAKHPEQWSAANEWHYMQDVQSWMDNPNAGAKLGKKSYSPYVDNSEKALKIIDKAKSDVQSFISSSGGMFTKTDIEQLTSKKIQDMLGASFNSNELAQFQIDSDYNTSQLSNEEKYNTVYNTYKNIYETNAKLARTQGVETLEGSSNYDYELASKAALETLQSLTNPEGEISRSTIDGLYSQIYKNDWVRGMGAAYSYSKVKKDMERDPLYLENLSHTHALERMKIEYAYKGAQAKQEKVKYPSVFKGDLNSAYLDKLATMPAGNIAFNKDELETNLDPNFVSWIMSEAAKIGTVTYGEYDESGNLVTDESKKGLKNNTMEYDKKLKQFKLHKKQDGSITYDLVFDNGSKLTLDDKTFDENYKGAFDSKLNNTLADLNAKLIAAGN